jgi:hypothetical protein
VPKTIQGPDVGQRFRTTPPRRKETNLGTPGSARGSAHVVISGAKALDAMNSAAWCSLDQIPAEATFGDLQIGWVELNAHEAAA